MLPHVVRWNAASVGGLYRDLVETAGWADAMTSSDTAGDQLAEGFTEFLRLADMPVSVSQAIDAVADETVIDELAADAVQQWTGTFNPRKMDATAFAEVYRNAL